MLLILNSGIRKYVKRKKDHVEDCAEGLCGMLSVSPDWDCAERVYGMSSATARLGVDCDEGLYAEGLC